MAQATAEQVKALEKAHKTALVNLLQAIRFRYLLYQKFGKSSDQWKTYANFVWNIWSKWYARQQKLEESGATQENILKDDWLTPSGLAKLKALAKKWDEKGEGVGFIPLLIWAVVAIAGFFTADQIVDELNTTTEEQESLIKTTQSYCEKYKLNADECKKFMTEQNTAVESGGSSGGTLMKWGLGALAIYLGFNLITNKTKK